MERIGELSRGDPSWNNAQARADVGFDNWILNLKCIAYGTAEVWQAQLQKNGLYFTPWNAAITDNVVWTRPIEVVGPALAVGELIQQGTYANIRTFQTTDVAQVFGISRTTRD